MNKATDALGKLMGGKTSANPADSTKTQQQTPKDQAKKAVNGLLDGLFKKKDNNQEQK